MLAQVTCQLHWAWDDNTDMARHCRVLKAISRLEEEEKNRDYDDAEDDELSGDDSADDNLWEPNDIGDDIPDLVSSENELSE